MSARSIPRMLSVYALGGVLCTAALAAHLQLWRADLDVPLEYTAQGDASFNSMVAKTVLEQGLGDHVIEGGVALGRVLQGDV